MTRDGGPQVKLHYKGKDDDFIVFVDDVKSFKEWKTDKSIPLAQVVSSFKVFVTHKHGAQGTLDAASKATLENEFGTHNEDEVIKKVLESGTLQETESMEKQGNRNDSMGSRAAH